MTHSDGRHDWGVTCGRWIGRRLAATGGLDTTSVRSTRRRAGATGEGVNVRRLARYMCLHSSHAQSSTSTTRTTPGLAREGWPRDGSLPRAVRMRSEVDGSCEVECACAYEQAKGNAAFSAGRFEEAVGHFSDAIKADEGNHVLYSNRSAAHASLKHFGAALDDAKKVRDETLSRVAGGVPLRCAAQCVWVTAYDGVYRFSFATYACSVPLRCCLWKGSERVSRRSPVPPPPPPPPSPPAGRW